MAPSSPTRHSSKSSKSHKSTKHRHSSSRSSPTLSSSRGRPGSHHPRSPRQRPRLRDDLTDSTQHPSSQPDEFAQSETSETESETEYDPISGTEAVDVGQKRHHHLDKGRARKKPRKPDELSTAARHFGRVHDMWARFSTIFREGLKYDPAKPLINHTEESAILLIEQFYIKLYLAFKDLAPGLATEIHRQSKETIADNLDRSRTTARGEDVKRVKDNVPILRPASNPWDPPIRPNDKVTRGFKHPQLARLVCPIGWLEEFDEDPSFRQKLADGKQIPHPHDFPLFLYDDDAFDIENLVDSFMKNDILLRAWRLIFQGPKAVEGQPSSKATKKGNARINGMKEITVPAIVYIATLVYFALGSQETFGAGGSDHEFNYYDFYRGLVAFIEDDMDHEARDDLIEWWNKRVFPSYAKSSNVPAARTGRALMKAQMQKSRGIRESTNVARI